MFDITSAIIAATLFSSIWMTAITVIAFICIILAIAVEEFASGYFAFFVYMVVFTIFSAHNPFVWVWHNPGDFVIFFVEYFAIGLVYSLIKYWVEMKKVVALLAEQKLSFIQQFSLDMLPKDPIPEVMRHDWGQHLRTNLSHDDYALVRKNGELGSKKSKSRIKHWIAFWPFSALGLFIADPLRYLVETMYNNMIALYGSIYDRVIGDKINKSDFLS